MNKKLLITLILLITVETAVIAYLIFGNDPGPNEEVIRLEEQNKILEQNLYVQKVETTKALGKVKELKASLKAVKDQKPIIVKKYVKERSRIRSLSPVESVQYLAEWLSETPDN